MKVTEPGYYWYQLNGRDKKTIVKVYQGYDTIYVSFFGSEYDMSIWQAEKEGKFISKIINDNEEKYMIELKDGHYWFRHKMYKVIEESMNRVGYIWKSSDDDEKWVILIGYPATPLKDILKSYYLLEEVKPCSI
jgi:hypothetical protein